MRIIIGRDDVKIGAYKYPDRKRPCLCVQKGNLTTVYGYFRDNESADEFMQELVQLVGAQPAEEDDHES